MPVFLIDDDNDLLDIMEEVLAMAGFSVQKMTDGAGVVSRVAADQPDLVIVDYLLPLVNGGELCAQLKKDPRTRHIPVILMTAYPRVLLSLGDYGCDDLIEKPFDIDDFADRVKFHAGAVLNLNDQDGGN